MGKPFIDLTNQVYGDWRVSPHHKSVPRPSGKGSPRTHWFCTCQCGNTAWVDATNLRQGISTNCGCRRETSSAKQQAARSAAGKANRTHGYSGNNNPDRRLYLIWAHMKDRCNNPNCTAYRYYGGRGITYSAKWEQFEPFLHWAKEAGYTELLTLERNDVNGNYTPENCCFVTKTQQQWNTRRTVRLSSGESISSFCHTYTVPSDLVWHALKLQREYPEAWNILFDVST
jgi:hypothetical protein